MTAVIEATGVSHRVGDHDVELLRAIELRVGAGEVVAVEGRSGSGKSTLLSILGLLLRPRSGEVRVRGTSTNALSDGERTRLRGSSIGFVFQNYSLIGTRNAWQNVALPLMAGRDVPVREHRARAVEALRLVGLDGRAEDMPAHLSGGEQQRVAIARSLVLRPELLLADEPTGALDVATGGSVLALLIDTARATGRALVLVTHDPLVAAQADRRLALQAGELRCAS